MLNRLEVITKYGVTLALPLDDISTGYSVQDIKGLDPVKANIVSTGFARLDGEQLQSTRREKRNLILTLGLEPDYTTQNVQQLRNNLYKYLMPEQEATLRFYADEFPTVDISVVVESFDCPIFAKEPVATISAIAHDPDFFEPVAIELAGFSTDTVGAYEVEYLGSVDTGFVFRMVPNRTLTSFILGSQASGDAEKQMTITGSFLTGDIIEISTVPGNKYATRTRGTVESSLLAAVSPYSEWCALKPGFNNVRVIAEGAAIPYTVTYSNKHGGL